MREILIPIQFHKSLPVKLRCLNSPTHFTQALPQADKGLIVKKRFYFILSVQIADRTSWFDHDMAI